MNVKDIMDKYLEGNNIDEDISRYFDPKIWGRKILGASVTDSPELTFSNIFDRYRDVFSTKKIIADVQRRINQGEDLNLIFKDLVGGKVKFSDKELNQVKSMFKKAEKTNTPRLKKNDTASPGRGSGSPRLVGFGTFKVSR
jgi:hypothetical protein